MDLIMILILIGCFGAIGSLAAWCNSQLTKED